MTSLSPDLTVKDVSRSVAFYRDTLGFTVRMSMTDDDGTPVWASIERGDIKMMMGVPMGKPYPEEPGAGVVLYCVIDEGEDINAFYARVQASGSPISQEIEDMFWGDRVFGVKDPDGYEIHVAKNVNEGDFSAFTLQMGDAVLAGVG